MTAPTADGPWGQLDPDASVDAASRLGGELLAIDQAVSRAKDAMKVWAGRHGPIAVEDGAWDWAVSQSRSVPDMVLRDALLADALAAGVDPALVESVPHTNVDALEKVAKQLKKTHPDLARALSGLVIKSPGSRSFKFRRIPATPSPTAAAQAAKEAS